MWYVVQVRVGTEKNIQIQCTKNVDSSVLHRCVIPHFEEKKRFHGEWKIQKRILFPGYVFMVTEDVEALYRQLHHVVGFTRLLASGTEIVPLSDPEIQFLESFGGPEQVVALSEGVIEGNQIVVHEGPLKGREGLICRIDRHKRLAWLELELFGRKQIVQVGLEVIRKT